MRNLVVFSALALAACNPPGDTGDTDTDTDAAVAPTDFGFVYLSSEPGLGFSDAGAVFRRLLPHAYDCAETAVAGCTVLTCGDAPLDYEPVDAGLITITGATSPIAMSYAAVDGYGDVFRPEEALFAGGETIAASAPGADGPAFALSAVAPTAVTIATPAWPSGQDTLAIPRASGFTFTWTGTSAGSVVANLSNNSQSIGVSCPFPAADGTATIPAEALAELPVGGGFLDIEGRSEDTAQINTWQVRLAVSTHALVAPLSPAIAGVRFQ